MTNDRNEQFLQKLEIIGISIRRAQKQLRHGDDKSAHKYMEAAAEFCTATMQFLREEEKNGVSNLP